MEYKQKLNNKIMIVQDEGLQKREKISKSRKHLYDCNKKQKLEWTITWIMVMVSQVCVYSQTNQHGYILCVQFFVYQVYFNKTVFLT